MIQPQFLFWCCSFSHNPWNNSQPRENPIGRSWKRMTVIFARHKVVGRKNSFDTISKIFFWSVKKTIQKTSSIFSRKTQLVLVKEHLSVNYKSNLDNLIRLFVTLGWFTFLIPAKLFTKKSSTPWKKSQEKKYVSRFNKTQPQTNACYNIWEKIVDGENKASPNQVLKNNFDAKVRKMVDNAVMTVKNRMQDAIFTAMDNVSSPWIEMVVRSIIGSLRQWPCNVVQNRDRKDFTANSESSLLMPPCSRLDLHVDQDRNGENQNVEIFEVGDFPALRPTYDRRAHAQHIQFYDVMKSGNYCWINLEFGDTTQTFQLEERNRLLP